MADSSHLFEADKERIANEAKVRTALEQPDFAQREFEKWQAEKDRQLQNESFATAWAKVAWLAEGRMHIMGRKLDKLQRRIGRQRKANRRQHHALKVAHERIEQLEGALGQIANAYKGVGVLEALLGGPSAGRLVGIADRALSDLKKEEEEGA